LKPILFILMLTVTLCSQSVTIQYDDGEAPDTQIKLGVDGWFFTTRFTPPQTPVVLEEAQFYLSESNKADGFIFCIFDGSTEMPGMKLIDPVPIRAEQTGWNVIDLQSWNLSVDGDFFFFF